jgi:hypothetical protein
MLSQRETTYRESLGKGDGSGLLPFFLRGGLAASLGPVVDLHVGGFLRLNLALDQLKSS